MRGTRKGSISRHILMETGLFCLGGRRQLSSIALLSAAAVPMLGDTAAIGIGAVAGAICRYQIGNIAAAKIARDPKRLSFISGWHTAGINVCGSLILGFLAGVPITSTTMSNGDQLIKGISPRTRLCVGVGFCGSFTTFSTYSVDIIGFLGRGEALRAISYIAANNIGGIGAAYTGFKVAKRIFG
jgi:CrcB protein